MVAGPVADKNVVSEYYCKLGQRALAPHRPSAEGAPARRLEVFLGGTPLMTLPRGRGYGRPDFALIPANGFELPGYCLPR